MEENQENQQEHEGLPGLEEKFGQANNTFCQFGCLGGGLAEIDLALTIERGETNKFLSITVVNYVKKEDTGDIQAFPNTMYVTDEKVFNDFKTFVASLQWKQL